MYFKKSEALKKTDSSVLQVAAQEVMSFMLAINSHE